MAVSVSLTVNGKAVSAEVDPRTLLVEFLRDELRLTGTHVGCDTAPVRRLHGASSTAARSSPARSSRCRRRAPKVTTIEGLAAADGTLHPMQAAFKECHGLQCGFCTPGMVMSAIDLVAAASEGVRSRRSARSSTATSAAAPATTTSSRRCSRAPPRWANRRARHGCQRATACIGAVGAPQGRLPLPDRRRASTPTTSTCRTSPRVFPALAARAREDPRRSTPTKAKAAPGRGRDLHRRRPRRGVSGLPCGWLITGTDGKPMKEPPHPVLAQGKVRHVGDQVALVIAETPNQAKDAAELIDVDYEVLPAVVDCVDALKPGAPQSTTRRRTTTATLGARRQGGGRRGVRQGGARHEARHRQQPADPERDRAARGHRVVQPRRRQLHALRRQPEPARRAAADDAPSCSACRSTRCA